MVIKMTENNLPIKPYPLGVHREGNSLRFSFVYAGKDCGIILYDRHTGKQLRRIPFEAGEAMGNVHCKFLDGVVPEDISYQFYAEGKLFPDKYARGFLGQHNYGKLRETKSLKAIIPSADYDWEQDERPKLPYNECLVYCMHVRGFTQHLSSEVSNRGTFRGIVEKIPYLKETGVTTVELQPAYEFLELTSPELPKGASYGVMTDMEGNKISPKLNYWGYKQGYYYAPKAAYAAGEDAATEFKDMVKAFHKNGMEVVMQFYFPNTVRTQEIPAILRFWVQEYHVDGFHLMGEKIHEDVIAQDPALADTKLWYYRFDTETIYQKDENIPYQNLAIYQDEYLYCMRKFLKGDEDMLSEVLYHLRCVPMQTGRIHFLSDYEGFTLADMVSYDYKHNEENGEENRDGNSFNCSWNCGEEGTSRRKKVLLLRQKQIKNAVCLLLFSQSTPLIFMGDEFGNSQKGNNNPYCQDNAVTWLNWKDLEKNKEIYQFWKQLVELRRKHPLLHPEKELRIMDYLSCGYPDLSYHGQNAWKAQTEGANRHIGLMFCGKYANIGDSKSADNNKQTGDDFIYLAMNMHWETHKLAMPKLPKGLKWQLLIHTEKDAEILKKITAESLEENEFSRTIPPRSICVYISVNEELAVNKNKKSKR